jgi:hypothetical protein
VGAAKLESIKKSRQTGRFVVRVASLEQQKRANRIGSPFIRSGFSSVAL